jgi:NAD(P)-dependent dehydrogenase (short-subunit alcohol dehydrogenase family)
VPDSGPPSPRVAVVTGAGRGVGRAIAVALADAGFAVALVSRSPQELAETERAVVGLGAAAAVLPCDVRDAAAVDEAIRLAVERLGPVDTLVNNAGTGLALGPLWEVDPTEWWTDIETTVRGAFNACRAVLPAMLDRGAGRIVNISSYVAVRPSPYQTGYACGKAGLLSLTESLAASLAPHGIQAFAVTPGVVETELTRRILESPEGQRWLPEVGTGRVLEPELGARLVVELASGRADALSGRFIHALDDLDELLRRLDEISEYDYYAPRLRRLPPEAS